MPAGPFPPRADAPWAELNKVTGPCGKDAFFEAGESSDAPLRLPDEIVSGSLETVPEDQSLKNYPDNPYPLN